MKKLVYIFFLNLFFISHLFAQCIEPDATIWKNTWASCEKTPNPKAEYGNSHWIQYNFGAVRNLSKTWVWNSNDPDKLNQGFHQVKIDYSNDGQSWTYFGDMSFPEAKGDAVYNGFEGPDLINIKAQYVLITVINNHGHPSCAGLAEIKFNLLPEEENIIPPIETGEEDEAEEEEEEEETNEDICSAIEEVDLSEFIEIETEFTEAFFFFELSGEIEELPLLFEYRLEGEDWIVLDVEEEIYLEDLITDTTYEYRVSILCGAEKKTTPIGIFQTNSCATIGDITIEEVTATEAFLLWRGLENQEVYFIEISQIGEEEKWELEVEEAEVFLDELEPNTTYEIRIGTECGEEINWSDEIQFTTNEELDISTSSITQSKLSAQQVLLFPNPTPGQLTIRIKTPKKDVLNYSISDNQGRILFRNTTKIYGGSNDLALDLSNLTDGIYWINGVTLNQRAAISEQIIKISK